MRMDIGEGGETKEKYQLHKVRLDETEKDQFVATWLQSWTHGDPFLIG